MRSAELSVGWLTTAVSLSGALILGAPFIGQLRVALRDGLGASFSTVMAVAVLGSLAAALVGALMRIRDRRTARYGAIAAALVIGVGFSLASRSGIPEVDSVERFHFVQYGLITFLFSRAFRPLQDAGAIAAPVLAALIVSVVEEWLQWFIPARVGEVRDVVLNLFAITTGLLFSLGLDPPERIALRLSRRSRRLTAALVAALLVIFGGFFHAVHLGHEIRDAEAGVFRSRYSAEEIARVAAERRARWQEAPPLTWSRLSREDQYFTEAVAHIQRRNEHWEQGNVPAARHENLILEKYYEPVLDTPSYLSATGHRWPAAQRADAEARKGPGFMIYVSDALDYPVVTWPAWALWAAVLTLALLVLRAVR